jgi:hypothetical protein
MHTSKRMDVCLVFLATITLVWFLIVYNTSVHWYFLRYKKIKNKSKGMEPSEPSAIKTTVVPTRGTGLLSRPELINIRRKWKL